MSEVKVNKISPRSGTTVTLGDSGDTFTIPSGATINNQGTATNFGATGAASWNTTVKTGDFTAVSGEGYFVNTTSGAITVTLPAGSAGAVVAIKDYAGTFDSNACTIDSNGSEKIGGSTNNAILRTEGQSVTLIYIDSTQGWLVTDDGLQSSANTNPYLEATVTGSGNTLATAPDCANMKIATFTGPGTFEVTRAAVAAADNLVSHMVIAGGGGGGSNYAGGGGAGGFREVVSPSSPYTGSPLNGYPTPGNRITVTATSFPITVGGGGAGGPGCNAKGSSGSNSSFSTITSAAGGGGGSAGVSACRGTGIPGGSGGGNSNDTQPVSAPSGNTPPVSPPQGNNGGRGRATGCNGSGGGGGATAVGGTGGCGLISAGPGGAGATSSITGSPVARAGGGGGGSQTGVAAGTGPSGGGAGGKRCTPTPNGTPGTVNTGGGGGGGGCSATTGGNGASGIVIIRYRFQ
jgi:hypothetical protein